VSAPNGKVVPKRIQGAEARRGGPPWMSAGMPAEKSMNFGPSAKRLVGRLRPQRAKVLLVLLLAVGSVSLAVIGPKILGRATDVIFTGFLGSRLPSGISLQQAIAAARASGDDNRAQLLATAHPTPGVGIDFTDLAHVLLLAVAVYVGASLLSWLQGWLLNDVVQTAVRRLRSDVEDKINRLPLPYFDRQPRGELLSRVTNDIDNIQMSLQQTMSQLLTSLLTVVGVVTMMFVISPVLAVIALVTIPVSMVVTKAIAKRSQGKFIAQWKNTGQLNGQIEEAFSGHELVKVFGRHREVQAEFDRKNEELFQASFGAQFISGIIMPTMMFIGNLNYVAIAVVGGLHRRVAPPPR
jgi:ATP-binding cassette subfamily B protein